ncbi:hypothetical protein [Oceanobacillus timonensis]|uniref:hypothetical protein n=1 Tax=Oceanobacillus timonensis TaxID=1926285 RepID=UPI0009BB53D2|nr:hypothetical protein [Oceanobacillus timonensis]
MRNHTQSLILLGIGLNIIQWVAILILFQRITALFGGYIIYNPNTINGTTRSGTFLDWLQTIVYANEPINYVLFFFVIASLLYLISTFVFIVLEIVAYFMIRKNAHSSWSAFILAMGFKNIITDLSGVPFLVAGLMMHKENKSDLDKKV